ncbi:efflux RND transporter permease subunit [Shewanella fodinae]|uniref:efflux RND transporter permease subunit n=1 Tax=Shewanella fodinae TaxID=552357 RepID=UPI001671FA4D|nr:efflux RND transporter permease subunit [Shewanella fodinae]MCL2908064.1 efflux RND transporter permease subunit [Shewanella fodinae]GGZ13068.1 acriflavin resistance protein [Shewanella fodinae]
MSMIDTSVKHPVTVWMFMLAIILFGMVGFSRLAVKLLPDLSYPTLTIRTQYDGAAPVEVEQLVSKPIEEAVGIVKGLRKISSVSRSGTSDVALEFEWGTNMDLAGLEVREKLDTIELPLDVDKPVLLRFNPNLDPIMRLALPAKDGSEAELKRLRSYAEEELKRELETLPGVASVRLSGGLEQEIHILLNQQKLSQLNLSSELIKQRIAEENINLSAGKVVQGDKEYLVRTVNQFRNLSELANIIVYKNGTTLVRLGDIAQVTDGFKERSDITRIGGKESIELALYKEGDANTVAVAQKVRQQLQRMQAQAAKTGAPVPEVIYDQSEFIESAVSEVTSSALIGSLLAMLVIYLFLRDIIPTLIISISIPFSVIATFNMMYFAGLSLNIMSLGGIALAVGLLVDNAIVVLENIDRCKATGMNRLDAAVTGTREVAGAITASTLTTLAVFVPLIFVDGIAGALFKDQALTVTFALLASLLVALTSIPMLASREGFKTLPPLVKRTSKPLPTSRWGKIRHYSATMFALPFTLLLNWLPRALMTIILLLVRLFSWLAGLLMRPLSALFNAGYQLLTKVYQPLLELALQHKALTIAIALLFTASAGLLVNRLGMQLIPPMNQGEFYVEILLPPGTDVSHTDRVLQQLASVISDDKAVKHAYSQAGSGGLMTSDTSRGGENWGRLQVVLADHHAFNEVAAKLRARARTIPELEANIKFPELFSFKTPLEIELSGYELGPLKQSADALVKALETDPRFTDINSTLRDGQPEISIRFDHARIAALGMDAPTIAERIAQRVGGTVASKYTLRERKIDILVRSAADERRQISDIGAMLINPDSAHPLPLSAVADVELALGPSAINRVSQQRVAIVSANLAYGDLNQAVASARQLLAQVPMSASVQTRIGGQNEEMENSFTSLKIALLLAVFLVYIVMASQFESLLHPLLILMAVPMALSGSIYGLWLTGSKLSVIVFIGLIMLAGIVVNNAIVLVDRINQQRAAGVEKLAAIREAAASRLRPILMTTLTTTLGLLPMAIGLGDGAEVRAPMAITVIFGLSLSTLLTLVVIPVLYALFDRKTYEITAAPASNATGAQV